jgi:hypothetical protein
MTKTMDSGNIVDTVRHSDPLRQNHELERKVVPLDDIYLFGFSKAEP